MNETARQIYEQAVYEAQKGMKDMLLEVLKPQGIEPEEVEPKKVKPRETAADRRNFYRKQAGWPLLKENNG